MDVSTPPLPLLLRTGDGEDQDQQHRAEAAETARRYLALSPEQEGERVFQPRTPRGLVVGGALVAADHEVPALDEALAEQPGAHDRVGGAVGGVEAE